jgi:O-antigen/teichoic acid export membrane protein
VKGLISRLIQLVPAGNLAQGALTTLAVKCLSMPITLLFQFALVRLLGPSAFGEFIYGYSWYLLLLPIAGFGVQEAIVRFVPEYRVQANPMAASGFINWAGRAGVVTSVSMAAAGFLTATALGDNISDSLFWTLILVSAALPLGTIGTMAASLLRAAESFARAQVPQQILRPLFTVLLAWLAISGFGFQRMSYVGAASFLASVFFFALISITFAARSYREISPVPGEVYSKREWRSAALHFLGLAVVALLGRVDILMVGALAGTFEAGVYSTAVYLAVFVEFGFSTMGVVTGPRIAALHASGRREELQEMLRLSWYATAAAAIPAAAVLLIAGRLVLRLFDPSFEAGYTALVLLTATALIRIAVGPVGRISTMTGFHREAFRLLSGAMLLNVVLNGLLIPAAGLNGAALATLISMAVWKGSGLVLVRKKIGVDPSVFSMLIKPPPDQQGIR